MAGRAQPRRGVARNPLTMPTDFRSIIDAELALQGRSRYWLAKHADCPVSASNLYAYLRGDQDLRAENVSAVLDLLGVRICPARRRR